MRRCSWARSISTACHDRSTSCSLGSELPTSLYRNWAQHSLPQEASRQSIIGPQAAFWGSRLHICLHAPSPPPPSMQSSTQLQSVSFWHAASSVGQFCAAQSRQLPADIPPAPAAPAVPPAPPDAMPPAPAAPPAPPPPVAPAPPPPVAPAPPPPVAPPAELELPPEDAPAPVEDEFCELVSS